jgi:NodT family efflux transporter outer membrane factor (OMF) lipoprotein
VNIRTLEERLRVAARNVETQKEGLRLATARFKAGEAGERDTLQAATQLAQTQAAVPRLQESLRQAKNALGVLLGDTPDQVDKHFTGPSHIPGAPAKVTMGIPRDLLRRRPDVRAAGLAAASRCALIGVAKAELYPAFSLSGEFGGASSNQGASLANLFNWRHRAVGAGFGFAFPFLDYDRLENQVRVQDAQFQEAILQYQNTVLAAQQEVENGLASFINEREAAALLTQAATAARRSTELAMIQYKSGQTDYTTVLTAEQAQLSVEDSLASTQGNVVLGLIAVYRALGGGWELRDGHDLVSDEIKAEMARRTDWGRLLGQAETRKESAEEARRPPERGDASK